MSPLWVVAITALGVLSVCLTVVVSAAPRVAIPEYRPTGLPLGAFLPSFSAKTASEQDVASSDLPNGALAILFLGARCTGCRQLIADVTLGRFDGEGPVRLLMIVDDLDTARALQTGTDSLVLVDRRRRLQRLFRVTVTPHLTVVDGERRVVATGTPQSVQALHDLLEQLDVQ